jgi:hypothetical protein
MLLSADLTWQQNYLGLELRSDESEQLHALAGHGVAVGTGKLVERLDPQCRLPG